MKRIADEYDDAALILFFTDLMTSDFGDDPEKPVLWVVHGDSRKFERLLYPQHPISKIQSWLLNPLKK